MKYHSSPLLFITGKGKITNVVPVLRSVESKICSLPFLFSFADSNGQFVLTIVLVLNSKKLKTLKLVEQCLASVVTFPPDIFVHQL